jgi:23S rRNA pseudouridine2605 synthase
VRTDNDTALPARLAGERLQKVLARAGFASRRKCEELILQGRVEVNGVVVARLGTRVDPDQVEIRVDGEPLKLKTRAYFMVHKPPGVVSTNADPAGRTRVVDLVPEMQGLFTVGRLDQSSEGLILVTNDGDWANRLTHPRFGVPKVYYAEVAGEPTADTIAILRKGIYLSDGFAQIVSAKVKARRKQSTVLEITLDEGKNREVRRLLAKVGHKVLALKRVAIGPLRLGELPRGAYRPLRNDEVALFASVSLHQPKKTRGKNSFRRGRRGSTK